MSFLTSPPSWTRPDGALWIERAAAAVRHSGSRQRLGQRSVPAAATVGRSQRPRQVQCRRRRQRQNPPIRVLTATPGASALIPPTGADPDSCRRLLNTAAAAALHRLRARQKKLTVFGFAELRTSTKHLGTLAGLVEVEAITMPKPGKKNQPPRADGFSRYVEMLPTTASRPTRDRARASWPEPEHRLRSSRPSRNRG